MLFSQQIVWRKFNAKVLLNLSSWLNRDGDKHLVISFHCNEDCEVLCRFKVLAPKKKIACISFFLVPHRPKHEFPLNGPFGDTSAILDSIISNSYYVMLGGQIHINRPILIYWTHPKTTDLSTRLWGINTEFVGFISRHTLRYTVLSWI